MICVFLTAQSLYAQKFVKNTYENSIILSQDTTIVVDKTIVENSLKIISKRNLTYNPQIINNRLKLNFLGEQDTLYIFFRKLNINLGVGKSAIDSTGISLFERATPIARSSSNNSLTDRLLIDSKKLEYTGSFSRGVSFGNTQDVVLNSNFNLQMRGDLGNDLFIRAAISDENIPIQPEGNTQVLQEFDKVFMEVRKGNTTITAGDYELERPNSYFINYYKKLKGLSINHVQKIKDSWTINTRGSFAVSRGKFRRQILEVVDGNQGPYKLQGEDGELFLQVLSGTERVFSDGLLLKRGENEDYVIDYNRGEIRFTPNSIITANRRIIVEFEYAVQSYLRSLYATETRLENKKWSFVLNFYNEQDSKSLSANIQLDSTDLANLRARGDEDIFRNGIFIPSEGASENLILYNQNNGILEFATEDTTNVFGAIFSNFGTNNGNYEIDPLARANGRVYKYVGEGRGSYRPQIPLTPPEKKQMSSISAKYQIKDSTFVFFESAMSNNDQNRFSQINNDDNIGFSFFGSIEDKRVIDKKHNILLQTSASFEKVDKDFISLNPYRNAEFIRDWNIESNTFKNEQQILNIGAEISKGKNTLKYNISQFSDRFIYKGERHLTELNLQHNGLLINAVGNWMNSENNLALENITFYRPKLNIKQSLFKDKWAIGYYFEKEKNIREFTQQDSLNALSFDYEYNKVFLENRTSENLSFILGVSQRKDLEYLKDVNAIFPSTTSTNIEFGGLWNSKSNSKLNWKLVLRDFKIEEEFQATKNPNKAFIGTIDHKLKLLNSGFTLNSFYESNSGQEPKVEFQYIKVQIGEGSYIWNDYNQDSIQQINEFEISPFSDQAAYEKITIFNNEFISTNRIILNQSLKINPQKFIKNKNSFINKWQVFSRYRIDQKRLNDNGGSLFQFVNFNQNADGFVAFNSSYDHSLFFNRGNTTFDSQFSYRTINNKFLQISGDDQRSNKTYYTRSRYNFKKKFDLILETNLGSRARTIEASINQDFNVNYWNLIPQLNFRPNSKLRLVAKYKYEKNKNTLGTNNESANINDGGLDLTWRQDANSNLQFKFNYVLINFDGAPNSPIEFEILQGLKNGQNLLWNLNYTRRISTSVDMIINYNGRKSEGSRLVNTAAVQMRAIF